MGHFVRNAVLVFIAGWVTWFLLDKPPMRPPRGHPSLDDGMLKDFQLAFDMLGAGQAKLAFVVLWQEQWLVLSLLGGFLVSSLTPSLWRGVSSLRRMRSARNDRRH